MGADEGCQGCAACGMRGCHRTSCAQFHGSFPCIPATTPSCRYNVFGWCMTQECPLAHRRPGDNGANAEPTRAECSDCGFPRSGLPGEGCEKPGNHGPKAPDLVNEPPHYRSVAGVTLKSGQRILAGDLEALDVFDAFDLDRYIANVCKYILRAGRKGPPIEDLKKARMLLDRRIARAERGE